MVVKDDGCADVTCLNHGFLARVIVNAEVLCQKCGRWICAESSEPSELRKRRNYNRDRKRGQRAQARLANLGHENVPL
jgi:hypothetical protein